MIHLEFGIVWNLLLAFLPVALGGAVAMVGREAKAQRKFLSWISFLVLLVLWLAMLPNTCYLLTEWRHFLDRVDTDSLYLRARTDHLVLLDISLMALFYLFYSGFGALTLTLSIRPVERMLRDWKVPFPLLAPVLFAMLSTGVYLGLILRLNSWDIWDRPRVVWAHLSQIPHSSLLMAAIAIFALLLWGLYEAMDLWLDGVEERLGRLRRTPGAASRPR